MRKLNPRVCRACGQLFQPRTALQRYGNAYCNAVGSGLHRRNWFPAGAVPGGKVSHP